MSVVRGQTSRRWATVGAATTMLVAIPVLLASRPVPTATLSPAAVLAAALRSAGVPHQGLVQLDASLGLPALPVISDETTILSGTTRIRTWWSTPRAWRVDTLSATGEEAIFADPANGAGEVRQWSFENNTVTQILNEPPVRLPRADDLVPPQFARRLLRWLGPRDQVLALDSRRVAGIDAAGARIVPGDDASTIGRIDVWVDPGTGLPLELDVFARGGTRPVLSSRFLDIDLTRPSPGVLSQTLVPTARQETTTEPDLLARVNSLVDVVLPDRLGSLRTVTGPAAAGLHGVASYGSGLTRVIVIPLPEQLAADIFDATATKGTKVHLPGGDITLLSTPLVTLAVVAGNGQGYIVAGTIRTGALQAAVTALLAHP